MKKYFRNLTFLFILSGLIHSFPERILSWGFFGHRHINRLAVFILPEGMFGFYKNHIEFLTEHSVDPDKRRNAVEAEAARHYIDLDHYSKEDPFGVMPQRWKDAAEKFSEDTLKEYGILPWHVPVVLNRLTEAFKNNDMDNILRHSAEIGHYIADAHVPLHTTENYNGQFTNQVGIHGFWESRLPELFSGNYDFFVGKVVYIDRPIEMIWQVIRESHLALDSVLKFEAILNQRFPGDQKYSFETRGQTNVRVYSEEYSRAYHEMLDGMVERRMRRAVQNVGSFWYTAWINAGKPDIEPMTDRKISEQLTKDLKTQEEKWQKGVLKRREHDD